MVSGREIKNLTEQETQRYRLKLSICHNLSKHTTICNNRFGRHICLKIYAMRHTITLCHPAENNTRRSAIHIVSFQFITISRYHSISTINPVFRQFSPCLWGKSCVGRNTNVQRTHLVFKGDINWSTGATISVLNL